MRNYPKYSFLAVLLAAIAPSAAFAGENNAPAPPKANHHASANNGSKFQLQDEAVEPNPEGAQQANQKVVQASSKTPESESETTVVEVVEESVGEGREGAPKSAHQKALDKKNEESTDGQYAYKRSYGVGFDIGHWFNDLNRIRLYTDPSSKTENRHLGQWHFDLFIETSFLEGTRLSLFGGVETPFLSDPSVLSVYAGVEPAFAFRRGLWEAAIGIGVGYGGVTFSGVKTKGQSESECQYENTMFLLRPFFEVRHYFTDYMGLYGRIGYQQWLFRGLGEGCQERAVPAGIINSQKFEPANLNEGGPYVSIGMRFGHYPFQENVIGDRDGDGYKDDVDSCPDDPEDFDGFEDEDGCPDLDNDKDGILDVKDQCPNDPEDKDGFEDEDGCPDPDNDQDKILDVNDQCPDDPEDYDGFEDENGCPDPDNDKDGILDVKDQCPNDPEDFDGLGDEDGCPETDFDNDGILDTEDKCPTVPGVPQKEGCPFEKVQITLDEIKILDKVFFAFDKAIIKRKSYGLLNDVADTIKAYPRIKKIEVGGHTDHKGSEKYNERLSQQRADAVRAYLIKRGISPDLLVAKGYGESSPLVPLPEDGKETKEGAEKNRRVEFKILEQDKIVKTVREDEADRVQEEDRKRKEAEKAAREKAASEQAEQAEEAKEDQAVGTTPAAAPEPTPAATQK